MIPVAHIIIHPTKASVIECLMSLRVAGKPSSVAAYMINRLVEFTGRTSRGAYFAKTFEAMWCAIHGVPSWRHRTLLDSIPAAAEVALEVRIAIHRAIDNLQPLIIMAHPELVELLRDKGYKLVFWKSDPSFMTPEELLECYPSDFSGISGSWLTHKASLEDYGDVNETHALSA